MSKKGADNQNINQEEFEKLQTEFQTLQETASRLEDQLKRAVADYQNLERRVAEGRQELSTWVTSELIKKLVIVLDYYDKALAGASEDDKKSAWYRGVEMATAQLRNVLRDEGLEEIGVDGHFDPALHEAVDTREGEDDKVLEVVDKGYNLNGKVLRPAKVVVGRQN